MTDLDEKAFRSLLWFFAAMAALIFIPAGTLAFWQAWLFLTVYFSLSLGMTFYLMKYDRPLMARRMRGGPGAEKDKTQKIVMTLASICFIALLFVPGLDRRFGWSSIPPMIAIIGDGLVILGYFIIFLVFRENSFSSATIETAENQTVISTGPYAAVRHPMYAGALIMLFGVPLALGSWLGLLMWMALVPVILWRLFEEERFLEKSLAGYSSYRVKVKCRLIPGVW